MGSANSVWRNLIERKVDGVVLVPVDPAAEHLEQLKDEKIKTILFCPPELADENFYCVDFDLASAPKLAVDHLAERGCRKIVLLDWRPAKPRASSWARNRSVLRKTFHASLRKHKLPTGTDYVWTLFGEKANPTDADKFRQLLSIHQPDGIIAMRDIQLLSAWKPLIEAGFSIPEDIHLVGCDDLSASQYWSPSLTTISMPKQELGKHVADILFDDSVQSSSRIFPVELVARDSS